MADHSKLLPLLLGFLLSCALSVVHGAEPTEGQLKAALLYKFAQFTTWPNLSGSEFNICLLGENPFGSELEKLKEMKLFQLPVNVLYLTSAESAKTCQVVYLNPADRRELTKWQDLLATLPILTVSDDPDAWRENVMIVFAVQPNGVKFKASLTAARAAHLSLSAQMLKIAQEVR